MSTLRNYPASQGKQTEQYRVVFNGGGTQWFDSYTEAAASRWMNEDGARIIARSGAQIIHASRHEVAARLKTAMRNGSAFAAQPVGACVYRIMEL